MKKEKKEWGRGLGFQGDHNWTANSFVEKTCNRGLGKSQLKRNL